MKIMEKKMTVEASGSAMKMIKEPMEVVLDTEWPKDGCNWSIQKWHWLVFDIGGGGVTKDKWSK